MAREQVNTPVTGTTESVETMTGAQEPIQGSAGVKDQLPGAPTTVSKTANAGGGIAPGKFVEVDIDEELFAFKGDDTPLMDMMLKAKKVPVKSAIVEHFMFDQQRSSVTVQTQLAAGKNNAKLELEETDKDIIRPCMTLLCKGVDGYEGTTRTPGKDLMLYVTGVDQASGDPIVRAVNGNRAANQEYGTIPLIPAGTELIILGNAMHETQKLVDPDTFVPEPNYVYLQKRGMTRIVSDYFASQKMRVPFKEAVIAEEAIRTFKTRGNRTLWAGRKGKMKVKTDMGDMQDVYFTEGIRWQFRRLVSHEGQWSYRDFIALAKMYYTGDDVPKTAAIVLCGKNFLESIQCIDFSKHPEVRIITKTEPKLGWEVTSIHTVFGDFDFKYEPTFERLGWSNSAAILSLDRLVHYQRTTEHSFNEKVDGQEARRSGTIVWDALALKGACHIWIDGEGEGNGNISGDGVTNFKIWEGNTAPTADDVNDGDVIYFLDNCVLDSDHTALSGQMWQVKKATSGGSTTLSWSLYKGFVVDDAA